MIIKKDEADSRNERKFLVEDLDKHEGEFIIKENPGLFSEIFYERTVNNLYLDTYDLHSYHDNVIGNKSRIKTRIRWYGELFGLVKKPVLEFKMKEGEIGFKKSYLLKSFTFDEKFTMDKLIEIAKLSKLPEEVVNYLKELNFSLVNRYRRKYFMSANKKFRITLDHDMEYFEPNHFKNNFKQVEEIIMELKYKAHEDDFASDISNHFPFRMTKSSKYITGKELFL